MGTKCSVPLLPTAQERAQRLTPRGSGSAGATALTAGGQDPELSVLTTLLPATQPGCTT